MIFGTFQARTRYLGDGVSTVFSAGFTYKANSDVKVVKRDATGVETTLVEGVGYTLAAGIVTLLTGALAVGTVLAIARDMPMVNTLNLVTNDNLPSGALQDALDRAFMASAQANDLYVGTLRVRVTDGLAGGMFDAGQNRIGAVSDPVLDTDAATAGWTKILLAQYSQGIASVVTPGGASTAQWNANKIQGQAVSATPPTNLQILSWNAANNRWEPTANPGVAQLLASNNSWAGTNDFLGTTTFVNLTNNTSGGTLNFANTLQRIQGRFFGTPYSDRTLFSPQLVPNSCYIGARPSGAGNEAGFYMFGGPDPDNAPALFISAGPVATSIQSIKTGAGVAQPLGINVGAFAGLTVRTNGRVGFQSAPDNGAEVNAGTGKISRNAAAFSAHRNGVAQSIPTAAFTKINWTTEDFDQAGWFDTGLARFVPLIPGKYSLYWALTIDAGMTDQKRIVSVLYKNGVFFKTGAQIHASGTAEPLSTVGSCIVDANGSTDYFEVYCIHDMTGAVNLPGNANDSYFTGFHIG